MTAAAIRRSIRSHVRRATRVSSNAPGACRGGSDTIGLRRVVRHRTPVRAISGAQAGRAQCPSRARSTQTESPPWAGRSPRASCPSVGLGVRAAAGVTPRADDLVPSACSRPAKPLVSTPPTSPLASKQRVVGSSPTEGRTPGLTSQVAGRNGRSADGRESREKMTRCRTGGSAWSWVAPCASPPALGSTSALGGCRRSSGVDGAMCGACGTLVAGSPSSDT